MDRVDAWIPLGTSVQKADGFVVEKAYGRVDLEKRDKGESR